MNMWSSSSISGGRRKIMRGAQRFDLVSYLVVGFAVVLSVAALFRLGNVRIVIIGNGGGGETSKRAHHFSTRQTLCRDSTHTYTTNIRSILITSSENVKSSENT
jgi:hypothetical protein